MLIITWEELVVSTHMWVILAILLDIVNIFRLYFCKTRCTYD